MSSTERWFSVSPDGVIMMHQENDEHAFLRYGSEATESEISVHTLLTRYRGKAVDDAILELERLGFIVDRVAKRITNPPKREVLYPVPELLRQILVTINMVEGTDEKRMGVVVEKLREAHEALIRRIQQHPDYQDNAALATLDKVYQEAGWDDNGLRYSSGGGNGYGEVLIVEFIPGTSNLNWRKA